jgi:hypothetical protein
MIRCIALWRACLPAVFTSVALNPGASGQSVTPPAAGITSPNDFKTVAEAKRHCGRRAIVWVIASAHVYLEKRDPGYGRTGQGAYMCEDEAMGDGNRRAR